jgi:MFS family permease
VDLLSVGNDNPGPEFTKNNHVLTLVQQGAFVVGYLADSIGRLKTIQLGCLWGILGAALLASAQNITWLSFARVISGIGCGHLNTTVPVWTSELADPHLRGAFVAVQFTLAMVGSTM